MVRAASRYTAAMNIPQIIERKRNGERHTREELEQLLFGYVAGRVPDYQVAAWLLARHGHH
jgi:pyrimidine-nucleoside phosphorylase